MIDRRSRAWVHPLRKGGHRGPGGVMVAGGASPKEADHSGQGSRLPGHELDLHVTTMEVTTMKQPELRRVSQLIGGGGFCRPAG